MKGKIYMKKMNWLTIIGGVATVAGFLIEIVQSYVEKEKETENTINEKIEEAFKERGLQ